MKEKRKNVVETLKTNTTATACLLFVVAALVLILAAVFLLKEFVVPVCVLIILEAGMAACLHKSEVWKHGLLLVAQLVAAIIIGRVLLAIICIIAYVAATVALQFITKK